MLVKIPVSASGFEYSQIVIKGNPVFGKKKLEEIIAITLKQPDKENSEDNQYSIEDKKSQHIRQALDNLYRDSGYIYSSVKIDKVTDKFLEIKIEEIGLKEIKIQGIQRLNKDYICERIFQAKVNPLNVRELEDQLKLLRVDPLFNYVEAKLRFDGKGIPSLDIIVEESRLVTIGLTTDNYSPPSLGGERIGIPNLRFRNITGIGDEISTA